MCSSRHPCRNALCLWRAVDLPVPGWRDINHTAAIVLRLAGSAATPTFARIASKPRPSRALPRVVFARARPINRTSAGLGAALWGGQRFHRRTRYERTSPGRSKDPAHALLSCARTWRALKRVQGALRPESMRCNPGAVVGPLRRSSNKAESQIHPTQHQQAVTTRCAWDAARRVTSDRRGPKEGVDSKRARRVLDKRHDRREAA